MKTLMKMILVILSSHIFIFGCFIDSSKNTNDNNSNTPNPTVMTGETYIPHYNIPTLYSLTSDNDSIYYGTLRELIEIKKDTKSRRTLTGIIPGIPDINGYVDPIVYNLDNLIKYGDYLYYFSNNTIQRVFTGVDTKSAVETVLPQSGFGEIVNMGDVTCNDTNFFWVNYDATNSTILMKNINSDTPHESIATFEGNLYLYPTNNYLYIITGAHYTGVSRVIKYDLAARNYIVLQDNISSEMKAFTLTDSHFYWANDDKLYRCDHSSDTPELITTGISNMRGIAVNGDKVFIIEAINPSSTGSYENILQFDLISEMSQVVYSGDVRGLVSVNTDTYFISAHALYKINPDLTTSVLYDVSGLDVLSSQIVILKNEIILYGIYNEELIYYDILKSMVRKHDYWGRRFFSNSENLFCSSYNWGIERIPDNHDFRLPEILAQRAQGSYYDDKMSIYNGYIYWTERSIPDNCQIWRMLTDGTGKEVLLDLTSEMIRGLIIHNEKIYFTYLPSGSSTWYLSSIPLSGGSITNEYGLCYGPVSLSENNGIFYLTDTCDGGISAAIYAINLTLNDHAEIISNLQTDPRTYDFSDLSQIKVSENWIYYNDEYYFNKYVIKRNPITEWNSVGEFQYIESDVSQNISGYHTDNTNFYYWHNGFKRLGE